VKSSRFGPIELEKEANHAGTSPQLTPDHPGSSPEKKKFRPKKCPTRELNPRHPDHKPWVRTRAKRLISLYKAYKAYKAYVTLIRLLRVAWGPKGVGGRKK
jgi:hypothetical protein